MANGVLELKRSTTNMSHSFFADDFLSTNPVTFHPETDILDAIHELLKYKVSGGTVINEQNEVVGVISELDCLKAIINMGYYREGGGKVKDFMTTGNIDCMQPRMSIVDAAQLILTTRHRRMPVVVDGRFAGQISARSILQAFKDSLVMSHDKTEDEVAI
jgi:CBS domain-containing protein